MSSGQARDFVPLFCARCSVELQPGSGTFYRVNIEAVADPTPPTITAEDLRNDPTAQIGKILEQMQELSEQEALDQVYRRLTIYLCCKCYAEWIEDPAS
jgi:hypothetical protein